MAGTEPVIHALPNADGDPLEGLGQSPFLVRPRTTEEAKRRQHIGDFVLTAVDRTQSLVDRENALRHLLICDPARAMGLLIDMAANALEHAEQQYGDQPGSAVASVRAAQRMINVLDTVLGGGTGLEVLLGDDDGR